MLRHLTPMIRSAKKSFVIRSFDMVAGVSTFLLLLPLNAVTQQYGSADGRWRVHGWLDGNDLEAECTLIQRGRTLRGTCTTEQGVSEISGQSQGSNVSWSYEGDSGGVPTTIRYNGALNGGRITGKISELDNPNAGAFKAELIR